jgi:WD40 repeat protein
MTFWKPLVFMMLAFSVVASISANEKPIHQFELDVSEDESYDVRLRPDGKLLLLVSPKRVLGFDPMTGRELFRHAPPDQVADKHGVRFQFSPDGKTIVVVGGAEVDLYSIEPWKKLRTLSGNEKDWFFFATAFSPDQKRVAAATTHKVGKTIEVIIVVREWDIATGKIVATHTGSTGGVLDFSMTYTPDGKRLIATDIGSQILQRDGEKTDDVLKFEVNDERIGAVVEEGAISLAFHPDGKKLAICGRNGIYLRDELLGKKSLATRWREDAYDDEGNTYPQHPGESEWAVREMAFTRDGAAVICIQDDSKDMHPHFWVRSAKTLEIKQMTKLPWSYHERLLVPKDSDVIVVCGTSEESKRLVIQTWDAAKLARLVK